MINVREVLGGINDDVNNDCDDIDNLSKQAALIEEKQELLDTPEAKCILRINQGLNQEHHSYNDRMAAMESRLQQREEWQRLVLNKVMKDIRLPHTSDEIGMAQGTALDEIADDGNGNAQENANNAGSDSHTTDEA
ncbi:hypothetical protein N7501_005118 [Penicillium viridicatum]|nr:hypothetical protein N7501_005118 [Penicillium viridicatum]